MIRFLRSFAGALTLATLAGTANAQDAATNYPHKPIRLIMPNAPGSSNDVLSRLLAIKLGELLRQQVVIDNRAGAGGTLGVETAARTPLPTATHSWRRRAQRTP